MPQVGNLRWTARTIVLPLLLSLLVHGLLILALWLWPTRKDSPTLTIQSTRITLDTCSLGSPSSTLLAERELPPELRGSSVDTSFAPRLEGPAPSSTRKQPAPVPASGASISTRKEQGNELGRGKSDNPSGETGSLFPLPTSVGSVVYVLDHSLSMGDNRKLDFARGELIASLQRLPPTARFQVIDYNESVQTLVIDGQSGLLSAEPAIVGKAILFLQTLGAAGKTNHLAALLHGVNLQPDVLYFLTDADDLKPEEVAFIARRNQRTIIHTIELTHRRSSTPDCSLAKLARDNHGNYRRVSVGD